MPRTFQLPLGTVHVHFDSYTPPDPKQDSRVIDGDTFVVGGQHWRLDGWDAPPIGPIGTNLTRNTGSHPHCQQELDKGEEAKRYAAYLLVDAAQRGALHVDVLAGPTDKYNRRLVRIWIDGVQMGLLMAEQGLAELYTPSLPKWGFCDCPERKEQYDVELEKHRLARQESQERRKLRRLVG